MGNAEREARAPVLDYSEPSGEIAARRRKGIDTFLYDPMRN